MKFEVGGLSPAAERAEGSIAVEIRTILNRVLLGVEERIGGLKILSVRENAASNIDPILMGVAILFYDIRVSEGEGRDFGTMIILELRRSYDEILDEIPFSDMAYMNKDLEFNWCTNVKQGEGYTMRYPLCVKDNFEGTPAMDQEGTPTMDQTMPTRTDITIRSDPNSDDGTGGLPGWAIALILFFCLALLICIGYLACMAKRRRDGTAEEEAEQRRDVFYPKRQDDANLQAYWEDDNSGQARSYRSEDNSGQVRSYHTDNRETSTGLRSKVSIESIRKARYGSKRIDRSTNRNAAIRDRTMYSANPGRPAGSNSSMYIAGRPGRDPSMYIPNARQGRDPSIFIDGNKDKPDPDTDTSNGGSMVASVGRDPTMYSANTAGHPGRDPSMYINDMPGRDPSMYIPGARQGRDPSFFIDGNEDRLDPDSSRGVMMATRDGDVGLPRRHYAKEPPLNPEIDP